MDKKEKNELVDNSVDDTVVAVENTVRTGIVKLISKYYILVEEEVNGAYDIVKLNNNKQASKVEEKINFTNEDVY